MITIKNVLQADNSRKDLSFASQETKTIDGSHLLAMPACIDPHVHFRVPGMEDKEDWLHGARAAFKGGYTTVFDMPNTKPTTTTVERLISKFNIIDGQLKEVGLPLKYKLFFGADKNNFQELAKLQANPALASRVCGIKVFMGASTGDLLMDDESSLHAVYALAKAHNMIISLHAEDELIIRANAEKYKNETDFKYHSIIREPQAAVKAVSLVIELSELYDVTSYILHVSTAAELELVKQAKAHGVKVFIETCPHYLFLDDSMYPQLHGRAKMNPPLRSKADQDVLWQAVNDGVIDTIGSDHAPHQLGEKEQPLCKCPSGVPGIETSLPLLLTAWKNGKVNLDTIIKLTSSNPSKLFDLPVNDDMVLVDIENYKELTDDMLATKVKWSPFSGMKLTGFVKYLATNGKFYEITDKINQL